MTKQEFDVQLAELKSTGTFTDESDNVYVYNSSEDVWELNGKKFNIQPANGESDDEENEYWTTGFEVVEIPAETEDPGVKDPEPEVLTHCVVHTDTELVWDDEKGQYVCPVCEASDNMIKIEDIIVNEPVDGTTDTPVAPVEPSNILAEYTTKVDTVCEYFDKDWEQYPDDDDWLTNKLKQQYCTDYDVFHTKVVDMLSNLEDIVYAENKENLPVDRFERIKKVKATKSAAKLEKVLAEAVDHLSWLKTRIEGDFEIYSKAAYVKAKEDGQIETFVY